MKKTITLVDYGLGNLHSITKALEYLEFEVVITQDPQEVLRAERLILPGVGAFGEGMAGLRARGLAQAIMASVQQGMPLLGICLGAQLLFSESEEFGLHEGLGLIPGKVMKIPHEKVKVPHTGWARLQNKMGPWTEGPLQSIPLGSWAYFVHSYQMLPEDPAHLYSVVAYGPYQLTAAIRKANLVGFQFHPEKSGKPGLQMLKNFCLE